MFSLADQHWQHYSLFPANTRQTFPEESFHFIWLWSPRWLLIEISCNLLNVSTGLSSNQACSVTSTKRQKQNKTCRKTKYLNYYYWLPGQSKLSLKQSTEVPSPSQTLRKLQSSFQHCWALTTLAAVLDRPKVRFRPQTKIFKGNYELP